MPRAKPRWAFNFYLTADNDLSKAIERQMKHFDGLDPRKVNVAVQIDTPRVRTKRGVLGENEKLEILEKSSGTKHNLNAGDPQTFVNFLFASKHLLRGGCTVVIVTGHCTGVADLAKLNREPGRDWRDTSRLRGAVALGIVNTSRDFLDNNDFDGALRAFR